MEAEARVMVQDIPDTYSEGTEVLEDDRNVRILHLQNQVLEKIAAIQESVRNAVINREWTDFESLLKTMNQYGDQFQILEAERAALVSRFLEGSGSPSPKAHHDTKSNFYSVVSRLPEQDRNSLTEMYRNLKLRVLKIRMANESLVAYLDEAKTMVNSFLEAAYPERKTRFYSRWGTKVAMDARSMMVNHSL
ncbi:MAG: flagellar export chaperone FlgN [Treponema sp.]|jgi:hypothetical protein|nr:flagellar export chaperone FlgN [Treponema sp.]